MIPKIIHFIWLTPVDGKPFLLHHKLSVLSAHKKNPDFKIWFHTDNPPASNHFKEIEHLVELKSVEIPHSVFGINITYMVMKADVLKLYIMKEHGGIYIDLDIITLNSYEKYLDNEVVLGMELSYFMNPRQILSFIRKFDFEIFKYKFRYPAGLCAGFMMGDKKSIFFEDWLQEYKNFSNDKWAYFPVKLPYLMWKTGKYKIHVISPYETHFPSCHPNDLKLIFEKEQVLRPNRLFLHLWESKSYDKYLQNLTTEKIRTGKSLFCKAVKDYV